MARGYFASATLLIFGLAIAGAARALPYPHQPGIAVEHYRFALEVGEKSREIVGETVITIRFTQSNVNRVTLDLARRDIEGGGMTVSAVTDDASGAALPFIHEGDRLTLRLETQPAAGEARHFRIAYAGEPRGGLLFGTTGQGYRAIASWNWPTKMRQWAPTIDHPASKATSEWIVTAPATYSVAANGLLQSTRALGDGRTTTHWRQAVPIAAWLNAVQIAPMQSWHGGNVRGIPLQIWAPAGRRVDVANGFLVARQSVELFSDLIGPYPYEKLGQVIAPFERSAMEHASIIFYGDGGTIDGQPAMPSRDDVAMANKGAAPHEIAHQWFGNSVTQAT